MRAELRAWLQSMSRSPIYRRRCTASRLHRSATSIVGPTIKGDYVQSIVGAVNRLQADMVAVTGDLVDGSVAQLRSHVAPLSGLTSRHGTYFVTGNHEYYSGVTAWVAELRRPRSQSPAQ